MANSTIAGERMLPVSEAAQRLGISRITLYEVCAAGRIRHLRLPGTGDRKTIRVPESAVQQLIERSMCGSDL